MGFGGAQNPLLNFQIATNQLFAREQQSAAAQEAAELRKQSNLVVDEAEQEARRRAREISLLQGAQASRYLAGGVLLDGSPLAVIEETRRLGEQEVSAIRRSGAAQARLFRLKADQAERGGLQNLLSTEAESAVARQQDDQRKKAQRAQFYQKVVSETGTLTEPLAELLFPNL